MLDGFALLITEGNAAATPTLQRAVRAVADMPVEDVLRWGWMAAGASAALWDHEGWLANCTRQVQVVRDAGALASLPIHLTYLGMAIVWTGDFAGAASLVAEIDSVAAVTGSRFPPYTLLRLRALQGREGEAAAAIASAIEQFGGQGMTATRAHWAAAVLYNGLARYEEAAQAARQATTNALNHWIPTWVLPELVEAAARLGDAELARDALERLAKTTQPCRTEFALGIEARCRALLSDGAAADDAVPRGDRAAAGAPGSVRRSPARTSSTASGCAARIAASTRASSCARRTRCWSRSGWRRSPSGRVWSFRPRARRCVSGRSKRETT